MYCPPLIWWQWTASTFLPGFNDAFAAGRISAGS